MHNYNSGSGKESGVIGYKIGGESIKVWFREGTYTYTYASAGKQAVETMKGLAINQLGLSTYIAQQKPDYEK